MTMHIVFAADVNTSPKPVRDTHRKIKTKRNRATAKKKLLYKTGLTLADVRL